MLCSFATNMAAVTSHANQQLLRMFSFLYFTSAVSNKLYYTGNGPLVSCEEPSLEYWIFVFLPYTQNHGEKCTIKKNIPKRMRCLN